MLAVFIKKELRFIRVASLILLYVSAMTRLNVSDRIYPWRFEQTIEGEWIARARNPKLWTKMAEVSVGDAQLH